VRNSDDWDFPSGEPLSLQTIGRIHRGTPWQTIYLKSGNILQPPTDLLSWKHWIGDMDNDIAFQTAPTNDWHLVGLLAPLINTNDLRQLLSVNNPDSEKWLSALDGFSAFTNSTPQQEILLSSNSPQARVIADAISRTRLAQSGNYFWNIGDILPTPELSDASPWLNTNYFNYQPLSDSAMEAIPSQLLPLLRADSIGVIAPANSSPQIQFTGYDGFSYVIEQSSNLMDWTAVSTNVPADGVFDFVPAKTAGAIFYRSKLLQ
jgi:hypothetical protein